MQTDSNTSTRGANVTWLARRVCRPDQYIKDVQTDAWQPIAKPLGALPNDTFVASVMPSDEPFRLAGILAGDVLIYLATEEVRHGDLIAAYHAGEAHTGFLHIGEDDGLCLHSASGAQFRLLHDARIVGRVVEVQRHCRPVKLRVSLRPVHTAWEALERGAA